MRQGKLPTPSAWFEGQLPNGTRASASLLLPPTTLAKFIERIYLVDQARAAAPPFLDHAERSAGRGCEAEFACCADHDERLPIDDAPDKDC